MIENLIKGLEQVSNLPTYIQNTGLALLGILIPLAIAILTEIYRKKGSSEEEFSELDLLVMLDNVFKVKYLLAYVLLIFVPLFFWDVSNGYLRLFELILSTVGICMTPLTILRVYNWTKGNVSKYRFSYLKQLKNPTDLGTAWQFVWKSKSIDVRDELQFFKIFSSAVDNNIEKENKNLIIAAKLLNNFSKFIKNRSSMFLVASNEVFPKILNWNFIAWKNEREYVDKKKENESDVWMRWFEISRCLHLIIVHTEKRALEEGYMICLFLKHLREHVNVYENKYGYIKYLLGIFYSTFFENISISENFAWNCFPDEWKITKENVIDKNNVIAKITFETFLQWTNKRISKIEERHDQKLENVVHNLFPEVDPPTWAAILIFVFSPYTPENRVKLAIERRWTFGIPRMRIFSGASLAEAKDKTKAQKLAEIKNTYELAILLFPNHFSKKLLQKYIEDTNKLKYPDDSEEERKRLKLLEIFQGMLDTLSQN